MNFQNDLKRSNPKKRLEAIENIEKSQDARQIAVLRDFIQNEKVGMLRERAEKAILSLEANEILNGEDDNNEASTTEPVTQAQAQRFYPPQRRHYRWGWEVFLALLLLNACILMSCYGIIYNKIQVNAWRYVEPEVSTEVYVAPVATEIPLTELALQRTESVATDAAGTEIAARNELARYETLPVTCLRDSLRGVSVLHHIDYLSHELWEGNAFHLSRGNTLEIPYRSEHNVGTEDFSFTVYFQAYDLSRPVVPIFDRRIVSAHGIRGMSFFIYEGSLAFEMADANSNEQYLSDISVTTNKWHMAAVTVERDETYGGRMYLDGERQYTFNPTNVSGSMDNVDPIYVGQDALMSSATDFEGQIASIDFFPCMVLRPDELEYLREEAENAIETEHE